MTKEFESDQQESATRDSEPDLDPQALAAIRNLLDTQYIQPDVTGEPVAPRQADRVVHAPLADIEPASASPQRVTAQRQSTSRRAAKKAKRVGIFGRLRSLFLGYRPSFKVAIWLSFALLLFMRPWLVLGLSLMTLVVLIGVFLIVGYDGCWRGAMGVARWYAGRRPNRAAELHRKLDAFAMKWDALLDRFPEGTVDGLYLPDFGNMATADARHDAALDRRLANLADSEV